MLDLGSPTSYLALAHGTPVFDADEVEIGVVDHVLADASVDVFDGVIVDTRTGPGGHRFADADQIAELFERGALLNVAGAELHEPSENPAVLDADPDDTADSRLRGRLRRAWDYLSGRY